MSDLVDGLKGHGLERYAPVFAANDVDLSTLDLLDDNDLASLGISLGNRRRLLAALSRMAEGRAVSKRELLSAGEPERRILSVVFIDIVGSVELFQRIDAEEMHELTKQFQSAVTAATLRYGGYVAQFAGDGVLSYFGWPQAHEDDAERAVRAAREAYEAIGAILHDGEPVLKARAGVATGEVVVGTIEGEILKDDGAAIGATLGLASRLQHLARPFEVVIGPLTRKLLAGTFALEDIGEYTLKGFAAPVRAWRIAGEETGVTRYERARAPGRSKLVGRAGDLRTLRAGWDAAKAGDGRLISISGDPGIGKSRLLEEFRTELHGERRFGFRYQCSPHHTNTALYPAIQNLRRTAGLAAAESDAARIEKLRRYLSLAPELLEHALPRLAALLRIDWPGRAAMDALPAQALRREVIACLVEHVLAMSKQHTVLLAVEDVHWADATTLDFIAQLAEHIAGRPILMLLTHRPEFEPEWQHLAHWEGLDLQRVGRRQAIRLARSIAPEGLDEETATQIVARADGVPLFIEEITRAVLDSGLEAGVAEVPATLQTSLLARLDAMGPGKIVAQIGAVIGRTFAHRHIDRLAALYGVEPEPALEQLVESGILFRHGVPPEAYYTFKHALLQDEAYATLLMRRRREIHLAYADMLDEQRGQGEGRAGLVGHHAFAAGDWVRAFDAFAEAGHDAVARSALVEASGQFRRALDAFGRLPETPECAEAGIDLMFSLRNVLWATGRFE
ncbi:MAG: AAA family ATPase, partial [Pseudomonadota bacterium]